MDLVWAVVIILSLVLEMSTGSFFLLAVSVGAIVANINNHLGCSISEQLTQAAIVTVIAVAVIYLVKKHFEKSAPQEKPQSLDLGHTVKVEKVEADGMAKVFYRGAYWLAQGERCQALKPGIYQIDGVIGQVLILKTK